jgi:hypothetical protein
VDVIVQIDKHTGIIWGLRTIHALTNFYYQGLPRSSPVVKTKAWLSFGERSLQPTLRIDAALGDNRDSISIFHNFRIDTFLAIEHDIEVVGGTRPIDAGDDMMFSVHKVVLDVIIDTNQFPFPAFRINGDVTFLPWITVPAKPPTLGTIETHLRFIVLIKMSPCVVQRRRNM